MNIYISIYRYRYRYILYGDFFPWGHSWSTYFTFDCWPPESSLTDLSQAQKLVVVVFLNDFIRLRICLGKMFCEKLTYEYIYIYI